MTRHESPTVRAASEHSFDTTPKPLSLCSETVVFSPLGLILNKINSNLSSRSNHSNHSNHKPDLCLVSQARLALEEEGGEVRHLPSTRFASFKHILFFIVAQVSDLVEALAKIHNSSLSRRTRCLETLLPILILRLQQEARRLVGLFRPYFSSYQHLIRGIWEQ
jgi:hypothetical protein